MKYILNADCKYTILYYRYIIANPDYVTALATCFDDTIIVLLRSDWSTSGRAVNRTGWPIHKV